jgi:hypothetical protein
MRGSPISVHLQATENQEENLHNKEGGKDSYNISIVMGIIRL